MRFAKLTAAMAIAAMLTIPGCTGADSSTIGRSALSAAKESRAEGGRHYAIGPQFEAKLEEMISQEVSALGVKESVPMELNRQVLLNINYFLNDARGFMTKGLSRGSKYIPMMKAIFRQKGLPEDLVYLALIESGFKNDAVSHASAVGPWQFIAATGRRYGLTINEWVDERRDPVKSTYAAADYLTTLHDMFNSWPLAIAAYNSGEGKIIKGMKNYGVSNFWDMSTVGGPPGRRDETLCAQLSGRHLHRQGPGRLRPDHRHAAPGPVGRSGGARSHHPERGGGHVRFQRRQTG
ncbi:lytic transglycosylase domain-containing protein [Deltaproteobacteria bacterium OttesenSCG-928-M10]|nr:lytic transglycosylase domain-containing protein [Deltaproteobacteria bacterium OttesenSCG-928-M10]